MYIKNISTIHPNYWGDVRQLGENKLGDTTSTEDTNLRLGAQGVPHGPHVGAALGEGLQRSERGLEKGGTWKKYCRILSMLYSFGPLPVRSQ